MKKILTLSLAAFAFLGLHAQTSKDEARKVVLGSPKKPASNGSPSTSSSEGREVVLGGGTDDSRTRPAGGPIASGTCATRISQVNRDYNAKIASIRANPTLTQQEKERMIRQLEKDRAKKLKEIDKQCGCKPDKAKDHGKHKGWTKGKGNAKHDH